MKLRSFFVREEQSSLRKGEHKKKPIRAKEKKSSSHSIDPCEECGLYKQCKSPKMNFTGEGRLGILVIGEAPGKTEDEQGVQFVGEAGQLLRRNLRKFGLNLDRDFWKINSVNCRPPGNRKPTKKELKCCWPRVEEVIRKLKPKFIWLMGGTAVESFYMGRFSDCSITRWRRLCVPEKRFNCWVIPLLHPSFVLRRNDESLEILFERDLKWALSCLKKDSPVFEDYEKRAKVLLDFNEVASLLEKVLKSREPVVFDYETTGLKPQRKGHKILTISLSFSEDLSYAFPFQYKDFWNDGEYKTIESLWKRILENNPLVAHNLKFEHKWSKFILGIEPKNWIWDTMVTAHILDCRPGFTGLKFQSYINWGVEEYEKEVKPYIRSKGSNDFNKLESFSLDRLLLYNSLDSLFTYKLWKKQEKELKGKLKKANSFFLEGLKALADAECFGIRVDVEYYEDQYDRLTNEIEKVENELRDSNEFEVFKEKTGKDLNFRSSKDLKELFYEVLKIKPEKFTSKGNPSVDEEVLASIGSEFSKNLIKLRKLEKVRDTYLEQFRREEVDGKIYPVFNLHIARTYRSSSDSPNFQNIPVRDEEAKKVTRGGIIPSPGFRIVEVDYSSIEVRIAACYTQDPVLVSYINDPSSDMHRDQAKEIFLLNDNQVTKKIRFYAKNNFVFPEFYGSWYKNCARNLWENVVEGGLETGEGIPVREHLRSKGISNYQKFEEHVRDVEDRFWKKFRVFKEWQEWILDFYRRRGYVEMFFGHRRSGYLTRNEVINTPIQGTAFHCLLWSFTRLNELRKKEQWKTKLVGQIHDSIVGDLDPDEQDHVLEMFRKVMCEDIREEHSWIIVPLDIEVELTPIDRSWYEKKETVKEKVVLKSKKEKDLWIMLEDKDKGILATKEEQKVIKKEGVWYEI